MPDVTAAVQRVLEDLEPGDVILVKASRSAGLDRVAQALLDAWPRPHRQSDGGSAL